MHKPEQPDTRSAAEGRAARRGMRRALWGAGIAVAGTAAMAAVALPDGAQGADRARNTAAAAPVTQRPAPTGVTKEGRGPLTKAEVDGARALALRADPMPEARDVQGRPGPEQLDADLAESAVAGGDQARLVEVLFYDYATNKLVKRTVNLGSGTVVRTDSASGMQPSPSRAEAAHAADLLIKSPLGAGLRADFQAAAGGARLTGAAQLTLRGIAYNAEQGGPPSLSACGAHRCVRLFTQVKGGPWIDTTDLVIDLSAGTVSRINP